MRHVRETRKTYMARIVVYRQHVLCKRVIRIGVYGCDAESYLSRTSLREFSEEFHEFDSHHGAVGADMGILRREDDPVLMNDISYFDR